MEKQRRLRFGIPIILLSLISLVFTVLSCTTYYVRFPWFLGLSSFLVSVSPYTLLVIYLLVFHNKFKAHLLIPVIFGLIAFTPIYYWIEDLILGYDIYLEDLILFDIPIIATFIIATVSALKGFFKKTSLIIAISVGLLVEIISIILFFQRIALYLEIELYLILFARPIGALGTISLYIALLLFGLMNPIPAILAVAPEQELKKAANMTPTQSLQLLNNKLDLGMITQEEYQAKRAEIIDNL